MWKRGRWRSKVTISHGWMDEVKGVINNRYELLLKARETPKNSKEWAEYRKSWLSQIVLVPRQKFQRSVINTTYWPFETKRCYHNKWCWQSEFNEIISNKHSIQIFKPTSQHLSCDTDSIRNPTFKRAPNEVFQIGNSYWKVMWTWWRHTKWYMKNIQSISINQLKMQFCTWLGTKWREALDSWKVIAVLFIDFRKAFDSVSHEILLRKISACGIAGDLHTYIHNYLQKRMK